MAREDRPSTTAGVRARFSLPHETPWRHSANRPEHRRPRPRVLAVRRCHAQAGDEQQLVGDQLPSYQPLIGYRVDADHHVEAFLHGINQPILGYDLQLHPWVGRDVARRDRAERHRGDLHRGTDPQRAAGRTAAG